jgi:predicted phosphohydrolase
MASPVRIAVTGDLHFDFSGYLTSPEKVRELAGRIRAESPDAVILAGDLGHGRVQFIECLACFKGFGMPVGVVAGNHDLWSDSRGGYSSLVLWKSLLPEAAAQAGAVWLERDNMILNNVAIVGSMAWYDYSALDPGLSYPPDELARMKPMLNNDGNFIDWPYTDPELAAELSEGLRARIAQAAASSAITDIIVVTHVPILEEQMVRKPDDPQWGATNAYFGNLTAGKWVLQEPKVRAIISGHTHIGRQGTVRRAGARPVRYDVVPSDYGSPAYVMVEI